MARITFTMDNGEQFVLSHQVYGVLPGRNAEPMDDKDARVQLSLITEKLRFFTVDDGTAVMVQHITSARISD